MGQLHALRVARRGVEVEAEAVAIFKIMRACGEGADAEFRALKIGQNGDGAAGIRFHLTDDLVAGADVVMCAVAHVQAEHIGPGLKQSADGFIIARDRPQSGHDLYVPKASHAFFPFGSCFVVGRGRE